MNTPETDAQTCWADEIKYAERVVPASLSRKLERERNEARLMARDQRNQICSCSRARLLFPWENAGSVARGLASQANYHMQPMKDLRKPAKQAHQGSEDSLQMRCAESLKKELMRCGLPQELFVHVPSEGVRKPQYRAKLKLMGFRAGIPDVLLFLRTKEFTGLACELKKAGGSPTKEQKDVMAALDNQGWLCVVVNDFETFQAVITSYIQC